MNCGLLTERSNGQVVTITDYRVVVARDRIDENADGFDSAATAVSKALRAVLVIRIP